MTPARLAWRTVRCGRPRAWAAMLAIGAAACMLAIGGGELRVLVPLLSLVACVSAAATALRTLARRRELATLRALGMPRSSLVLMLELEVLWITCAGVLPGLGLGAVVAWRTQRSIGLPRLLAEREMTTLSGLGALLALVIIAALLAALVPAIRAARHDVVAGLAVLPPHQEA